ncbi:DUF354 domain-containing protein [Balneolaceae bacterium ANBcel3]|nr:DUF354 domain-containing protein [Balneolaceae bacterium ANBcel3]
MKIFIDIGHPAHVHYFKNFYRIMSQQGHEFLIIARDKEISQQLLDSYEIPYLSRGKGRKSTFGKLVYLLKANMLLLKNALSFKPDLFLSFSSPYAAQVSSILRKPHIAFDDTEHARLGRMMYRPFTDLVLSPESYKGKLSQKQTLFKGYMELCYLHPNYFKPDPTVLQMLGVEEGERYIVLRFVSWNATHDSGHSGISLENKRVTVKEFSKYGRVFISSEEQLPKELQPYRISIPPDKMHDVLNYATLFFGESATMASESAVLGTPAIYLDNEGRGYTDDLERSYGLVHNFTESPQDQEKAIQKGIDLLQNRNIKLESMANRKRLLEEKIDVTDFLIKKVEEVIKQSASAS